MEVRNACSLLLAFAAISSAICSPLLSMPGDRRYGGISMHSNGARRRFGMSFFIPRQKGDTWINPNDSPNFYGLEGSEGKIDGQEQSDQDDASSKEEFVNWLRRWAVPQEPLGDSPAVPNNGGKDQDLEPHHNMGAISMSVVDNHVDPDAFITIVKD